jgi:hypothetical protein
MICPLKPIKNRPTKTSSIDKAFALPDRATPLEPVSWSSPLTAGPYLVPVTRWIE